MAFHTRNESAMNEEKDTIEKQAAEWGLDADMLYLQPGSTMVRILPAYSEAGLFFRKIVKHRVRSGGRTFVGACPMETEGSFCAICSKAQELKDSGDQFQMKFAKDQLRPQVKYLYNVLCYSSPADKRGGTTEFGKVYVMEAGIMVHKQLVSLDTDTMTGWVDITNLNNGVTLVIKRTGSGLDTKYEVAPTGHGRSDVLADLQARGIDVSKLEPTDLDTLYTVPPQDKLEEIVGNLQITGPQPTAPPMQPVMAGPPAAQTAPPVMPTPPAPAAVAPPPAAPMMAPAPAAPLTVATPQPVTVTQAPQPQPVAPEDPAPAIPAPPIPEPPTQ